MKFSLAFTGLLASVAVAAPAEVQRRDISYTATECVDPKDGFHVVTAGGEYTTVGNLSLLLTLAQSVLNIASGSNMWQVPYVQNDTPQNDISNGITEFRNHFLDYAQRCPKSKIVTLGYSVGAAVVMDTFCGSPLNPQAFQPISRDLRENLLANIVYGDLTFVGTQRSAIGSCPTDTGHGVVPRAFPGKCYPFGRKTQSYCDNFDPQCCTPNEGSPQIHFGYPAAYDAQATAFVQQRWEWFQKHRLN